MDTFILFERFWCLFSDMQAFSPFSVEPSPLFQRIHHRPSSKVSRAGKGLSVTDELVSAANGQLRQNGDHPASPRRAAALKVFIPRSP